MCKVSVVIPTYNYGQFIGEAIESVLVQTLPASEIIVVDDGSTDETEEVVSLFGDKVRYLRQENRGVSSARNNGTANSSGQFVAFLDADDIWESTKLKKQFAKFREDSEIGLVSCGMREFDSQTGETIAIHLEGSEGWVAGDIVLGRPVIGPGGSIVVKREVMDDVGGFDTRLKNGEDWEFCLRVAKKYKVGFVAEPLFQYRNHDANATKNIDEMERSTLLAWATAFDTTDETLLKLKRRSYGNLHKVLAGSFLHSRQYPGFIRNLVKSLWYRPSLLRYYLQRPFGWTANDHFP